jgi:hypothetical protein
MGKKKTHITHNLIVVVKIIMTKRFAGFGKEILLIAHLFLPTHILSYVFERSRYGLIISGGYGKYQLVIYEKVA